MSMMTFMVAQPVGADTPPTTRVTRHVVGRRAVLTVYGEIDAYSAPALGHAVDMVLAGGAGELWIDFSPTEFMDSAGLHLVVDASRRMGELNRRLAIICPPGSVRRLFELTGEGTRLAVYDDKVAAHRAG